MEFQSDQRQNIDDPCVDDVQLGPAANLSIYNEIWTMNLLSKMFVKQGGRRASVVVVVGDIGSRTRQARVCDGV